MSIPKIVGVLSCGFVLCAALSHAAPASAADDVKAGQTDRKAGQGGGKGEQDKMKGDDMKAGQSARKGGQDGMKGEEGKQKGVDMNTGQTPEKKKEIDQNVMGK